MRRLSGSPFILYCECEYSLYVQVVVCIRLHIDAWNTDHFSYLDVYLRQYSHLQDFKMYYTLFSLAILFFANAATAATLVDIEAIEAHFNQALLVPSLLPDFTPGATLSLAFSASAVSPGQALSQTGQ